MHRGQTSATFVDCAVHGAGTGAELFIVEGESAARSVVAVRSAKSQAVLPLQGKPMNAWRAASAARVREQPLYAQFASAMGLSDATALEHADPSAVAALRFERVVLLMDPDADGIHIGALMLLFFHRFAPALLAMGRVLQTRAPMFVLEPSDSSAGAGSTTRLAHHPAERDALIRAMTTECGGVPPRVQAVRGLASVSPSLLAQRCVDPATRVATVVTQRDVDAVIEVFGGID